MRLDCWRWLDAAGVGEELTGELGGTVENCRGLARRSIRYSVALDAASDRSRQLSTCCGSRSVGCGLCCSA